MRENVHPNKYPICGPGKQDVNERAEQAQSDNSDKYPWVLHKMWLRGAWCESFESTVYGFLVGFVAVVTVVFVVIKGIWIMAAVSRGEANKMELRRPLTCSRSSLRLTSFMLFMTFCCSSLLLAHEFSVHLFWFGLCCCSYWIKSVSAS